MLELNKVYLFEDNADRLFFNIKRLSGSNFLFLDTELERVEDGYAVFMVCHSFPSRILLRDYLRAQLTGDSFLEVLTQDDCISLCVGF